MEAAAWRCSYCLIAPATTVDHVRPRCRGGRNVHGNLVAACAPCNSAKAGMSIVEWIDVAAEARARQMIAVGYPLRLRARLRATILRRRHHLLSTH